MINSLYNHKSKEIKISKKNIDKIFKDIEADFFVEINVTTTSIVKYLSKKTNNLIHFCCPIDALVFRDIRDNCKNIIKKAKGLKIDKKFLEDYNGEHNSLLCFIKKYIENQISIKKIPIKQITSQILELSKNLKQIFISNKNSLDVVKAFNEENNLILIHLNDNYQAFFKLHGNFLMFHKAKILLIGNALSEQTFYLKKYGFKCFHKKLTKNIVWSKNI